MNCTYENYLYIYNIKLMEENVLLIKKITFKHVQNSNSCKINRALVGAPHT